MLTSKPTAEEQFVLYHDKLRDEINRAYTHYEICKSLRSCSETNRAEYSEALTFFGLTLNAHLFETIMNISRFFDTRDDTLQLDSFFRFIKNNLDLFSVEAYKKRLLEKGRNAEDREYFANIHASITKETVDEDTERIKRLSVTNIKLWRHKKLAHLDELLVLKDIDIMKDYPITIQEIDDIITTIHDVLDQYFSAYNGIVWVLGLPPAVPQIKYIMDALKSYRESRKHLREDTQKAREAGGEQAR